MTRTWREPPGEWIASDAEFPGFLDHLDLASIDDLVGRHGLRAAETLIANRLLELGGGRPVFLIDHMEQH
jgi:hypothetical protein